MIYRKCGESGLKLPLFSLGMWKNFGYEKDFSIVEEMCHTAFDNGITYFDLANNYGTPDGSAELNFGKVLKNGMNSHRDEMVIATKAGYDMWGGPYGSKGGSRKYLIASLDQSLKRMGLDYVDIFYHHVFDGDTPMLETALALEQIVRSGKALYVGISNYNKEQTAEMYGLLKELKVPFIINQPMHSILHRWNEVDGLVDYCADNGIGMAAYCPLHQGLLTDKYLNCVPKNTRASNEAWLSEQLNDEMLGKLKKLNTIAEGRNQKLSQMALAWILQSGKFTTVLLGASKPEQILENLKTLDNLEFTEEELKEIDTLFLPRT